jgi:hypothetical protein
METCIRGVEKAATKATASAPEHAKTVTFDDFDRFDYE